MVLGVREYKVVNLCDRKYRNTRYFTTNAYYCLCDHNNICLRINLDVTCVRGFSTADHVLYIKNTINNTFRSKS